MLTLQNVHAMYWSIDDFLHHKYYIYKDAKKHVN